LPLSDTRDAWAYHSPSFVTYQGKDGKSSTFHKIEIRILCAGVKKIAGPTDTLLLMCPGSVAARPWQPTSCGSALSKNTYNITDGMEGDKVENPESVFHGKRMKNGWQELGIAWIYSIDPEKIILGRRIQANTIEKGGER